MKRIIFLKYFLILILSAIIYSCSSGGSSINTDDPEKAFSIAKRHFDRGDYVDAIEDFSLIKLKFPGTSVSDKAQFYLAESYFGQKEYLLSAYEYEMMLKNYPLSTLIPQTRYKLGLSYYHLSPKYSLDQEFTRYAINELQAFLELFPEDKNVNDAEAKLKELENKLAYKDFHTAELYMKLDNYRSAAIYFNNVYEQFIESEWADDAMIGHADALINMKKYTDAEKVLERFYKLFPNSKLKPKADKLKYSI
jgi:outer membrane protein assembly factor BamD